MMFEMMEMYFKVMKLMLLLWGVGCELMSGCVMQEEKARERAGGGSALYLWLGHRRRGG